MDSDKGVSRAGAVAFRTKAALSPNQRRLLERMQQLGFGIICKLHICNGDPEFDPPFEVRRTFRTHGVNTPRPEAALSDFALKKEHIVFFEELKSLDDCVIEVLKVQDGLPVSCEINEAC